eukprot:4291799-Prymnesium_polylepis.1
MRRGAPKAAVGRPHLARAPERRVPTSGPCGCPSPGPSMSHAARRRQTRAPNQLGAAAVGRRDSRGSERGTAGGAAAAAGHESKRQQEFE